DRLLTGEEDRVGERLRRDLIPLEVRVRNGHSVRDGHAPNGHHAVAAHREVRVDHEKDLREHDVEEVEVRDVDLRPLRTCPRRLPWQGYRTRGCVVDTHRRADRVAGYRLQAASVI